MTASPVREKNPNGEPAAIAPPARCAKNAISPKTIESKKNGDFSAHKLFTIFAPAGFHLKPAKRFKGQKSINNKTSGTVTNMDFENNPKTKNPNASLL